VDSFVSARLHNMTEADQKCCQLKYPREVRTHSRIRYVYRVPAKKRLLQGFLFFIRDQKTMSNFKFLANLSGVLSAQQCTCYLAN